MKCCGRKEPIGTDREHLRLSFETDGNREIISYEIRVALSAEHLKRKIYDIGVFTGAEEGGCILWLDKSLFRERTRYYWQVAAATKEGICVSQTSFFETGIDGWHADWIGGDTSDGTVLEFQRTFELEAQGSVGEAITSARLYICGLGYFKARLNGVELGNEFYKPLVTNYSFRHCPENAYLYPDSGHRITYYTYDVTDYLQAGTNNLTVDVANGYYCNVEQSISEGNYSFGEPKLAFELYVSRKGEAADCTAGEQEQLLKSDTDTMVRNSWIKSMLREGDFADFTREARAYQKSRKVRAPDGKNVSPLCEGDQVNTEYRVIGMRRLPEGMLYDFGVNHTGGLKMTVTAKEGDVCHIRYAEVLDEQGNPNFETGAWHGEDRKNGRKKDIYQESRYILKEGINEITPLFGWHCYRYALVECPDTVRIEELQSLFIHMALEKNGHFACSEESLMRLNEMCVQTLFCNMHSGLVTDCPHREKLPYTGDAHMTMKAALYNMDAVSFYYKVFEDLLDAQTPEGLIPNSAPNFGGGGGYAWGNAVCFVTKYLYSFTGDGRVAERGYEAILKWLSYYKSKEDENHIIYRNSHSWLLGDWMAPDTVASDVYYISTVCYLMAVDTAVFFAGLLEREQQKELMQLRNDIVDGINRIFFDQERMTYGNGVQGEDMLALAAGIVPKNCEKAFKDKVSYHYEKETDGHLDTGIVLTPILIDYLTEHGMRKLAYRIMTAEGYPSYRYLMETDTTFCEHWSKKWPDYYTGDHKSRLVKGGGELSHCHPMYGSVASWLYERVAGLDLSLLYQKKVRISPYFTDCMEWARADKIVPYGKISVEWENKEEGLTLRALIPEGLTGVFEFPSQYAELRCQTSEISIKAEDGYFRFEIPSGEWVFQTVNKNLMINEEETA